MALRGLTALLPARRVAGMAAVRGIGWIGSCADEAAPQIPETRIQRPDKNLTRTARHFRFKGSSGTTMLELTKTGGSGKGKIGKNAKFGKWLILSGLRLLPDGIRPVSKHFTSTGTDLTCPRNRLTRPRDRLTRPRDRLTRPRNRLTRPWNRLTARGTG